MYVKTCQKKSHNAYSYPAVFPILPTPICVRQDKHPSCHMSRNTVTIHYLQQLTKSSGRQNCDYRTQVLVFLSSLRDSSSTCAGISVCRFISRDYSQDLLVHILRSIHTDFCWIHTYFGCIHLHFGWIPPISALIHIDFGFGTTIQTVFQVLYCILTEGVETKSVGGHAHAVIQTPVVKDARDI